jgi:serine/threonine-protein kinase
MGEMLGTPHYLSPEQALGEPATGASDLYALGVVAHEMLSGKRPFDGGTPVATALRHVHEPPPPLPAGVPESLAHVIEDLLAKDPADRPPNARAVAVRLGLADHEIIGQALSLARMVYGDDPEVPVDAASVESPESPPTVAVVVVD